MAATFIILAFFILGDVLATENRTSNEKLYKEEHCIKMTPKKEAEIQLIIKKIADFTNDLTEQHDEFDIRLLQFDIEQHSDDEVDEKETVLQVTINDCAEVAEEEKKEKEKEEKDKEEQEKEEKKEKQEKDEITKAEKDKEIASQSIEDNKAIPEIYTLDLDEPGQELLEELEKRRGPIKALLVYIQEFLGRKEYIFPPQK